MRRSSDRPIDGGPAFPRSTKWGLDRSIVQQGSKGMTLRDYFASQALNGYTSRNGGTGFPTAECMAEVCYAVADAMLNERDRA